MNNFKDYVSFHADALGQISELEIDNLTKQIRKVFDGNGILWTAGNGGSATTASHAQCDLSKGIHKKMDIQSRTICLTDMVGTASAWANDFSFDSGIANLCANFIQSKDALLLISGSGNSQNIVNSAIYAKSKNIKVLALTGFDGGILKTIADDCINVPSNDMQIIENIHLMLIHWILKSY
jgi:D-sedoheptulose 7-phosphate isomerase